MGAKECACASDVIFLMERLDILRTEVVGFPETKVSERSVAEDFDFAREKIDDVEKYCEVDLASVREKLDYAHDFWRRGKYRDSFGEVHHSELIVRNKILRGRGGEKW